MSDTPPFDLDEQPSIAGLPPVLDVGRRYSNPPIIEATIDLRVGGDPNVSVEALKAVLDPPEYSDLSEIYKESSSEWDDSDQRTTLRTVRGYRAKSTDESHGVVVTAHRFSFSRIGEYGDWSSFLSSAEQCWDVYREISAPQSVTRATVRYVNLIQVPKDAYELRDYLRTSFELSPYLPQVVTDFYTQIECPLPNILSGFTPEAVVAVASAQAQGMLLDIAVGIDIELNTQDPGFSTELTGVLTKLRHAKNFVFETCITDATRSLIS